MKKTTLRPQSNLPLPTTSFVGRVLVLERLQEMFSKKRLITLLGPPGVGKTRLAKEFGRQHLTSFPGGVWFCDLSEAKNDADIHLSVYQALGQKSPLDESFSQVGTVLSGRPKLLLILDNFEQLVSLAKDTIALWLEQAPLVHILVTSRETLRLTEETLFPLSPLSLPKGRDYISSEAVELFVARTRDAGLPLNLEEEGDNVGLLCQKLDGIPLALELAAARMRVFSPSQLVSRLEQRFLLLSRSSINTVEKHSTFERALDFSWGLLLPYEQATLVQCTVFRGGFTLEAVEEVLDLGGYPEAPWIPDLLQSLCEKSMLVRQETKTQQTRFTMYLGLRDYFERKAKQGRQKIFYRHAQYFLEKAEEFGKNVLFDENQKALTWLTLERENLLVIHQRALEAKLPSREGLRSALVLSPLLFLQGLLRLGISLFQEALALQHPKDSLLLLGWAYAKLVELQRRVTLPNKNLPLCQKAKAIAEEGKEPLLLIYTLGVEGSVLRSAGQYQEATRSLEQALSLSQMLGHISFISWSSIRLSIVAEHLDNLVKARDYGERALKAARQAKAFRLEQLALNNLGVFARRQGYLEEAKVYLEQYYLLSQDSIDKRREGSALHALAEIAFKGGKWKEAKEQLQEALGIFHEAGARAQEGDILDSLALLEQEQGDYQKAKQYYQEALQIAQSLKLQKLESVIWLHQGMLYQEQNQLKSAKENYQQALALYPTLDTPLHLSAVLALLGALFAKEDKFSEAKKAFLAAEKKLSNAPPVYPILLALSRGYLTLKEAEQAQAFGELANAKTLQENIRQLLISSRHPTTLYSVLGRFALRLLERDLSALGQERPPFTLPEEKDYPKEALLFSQAERKFRPPDHPWVSLRRRHPLFLLFQRLVSARRSSVPKALSWEELSSVGWPGERLERKTRQNRLYTALSMLRKLGLQGILLHKKDGYWLDPAVPVIFLDER